MEFLTKKFKTDQKKRRDLQSSLNISPDSASKKKKSTLTLRSRDSDKREKSNDFRDRHPFPFYISVPPYNKGDIPDSIDEYIHHLLSSLEQAKQAYEELEKKIH
jgi:hypothetical protein